MMYGHVVFTDEAITDPLAQVLVDCLPGPTPAVHFDTINFHCRPTLCAGILPRSARPINDPAKPWKIWQFLNRQPSFNISTLFLPILLVIESPLLDCDNQIQTAAKSLTIR